MFDTFLLWASSKRVILFVVTFVLAFLAQALAEPFGQSLYKWWQKRFEADVLWIVIVGVLLGLVVITGLFFLSKWAVGKVGSMGLVTGLMMVVAVMSFFVDSVRNGLPLLVMLLGIPLTFWTFQRAGGGPKVEAPGWASSTVILEDRLVGLRSKAGGYIRKKWTGMEEKDDHERDKVVYIDSREGYLRYEKQLPLDEGTVAVCIKLPDDPEDFVAGVILQDGDLKAEPNFGIEIDSNHLVKFSYKPEGADDWVEANRRRGEPLATHHWYQVAATWGLKGMKLTVLDLEVPGHRVIVAETDCTQPICRRTTHFAIGRMFHEDIAAQNVLLSDLKVYDSQDAYYNLLKGSE